MKKSVVILFLSAILFLSCDKGPGDASHSGVDVQQETVSDNMALIKGGTFLMGDASADEHLIKALQHQVTVSDFFMGKYEVTQKEYQEIMGENPSRFQGDNDPV